MQASLKHWNDWAAKFKATGNIVDEGDGLKPCGKVVKGGGIVTDGPFMEAKEVCGGFSIILAKDYAEAVKIAQACPMVQFGGNVEIREMAGYV